MQVNDTNTPDNRQQALDDYASVYNRLTEFIDSTDNRLHKRMAYKQRYHTFCQIVALTKQAENQ